jgi:hypothetical protein
MTELLKRALVLRRERLLYDAAEQEDLSPYMPEEARPVAAEIARRCRNAAACFELPAEAGGEELCVAHMRLEPCPTCAAYKAAGL